MLAVPEQDREARCRFCGKRRDQVAGLAAMSAARLVTAPRTASSIARWPPWIHDDRPSGHIGGTGAVTRRRRHPHQDVAVKEAERSPRCELVAGRSIEVVDADQEANLGRWRSPAVGAVAAVCCCRWRSQFRASRVYWNTARRISSGSSSSSTAGARRGNRVPNGASNARSSLSQVRRATPR